MFRCVVWCETGASHHHDLIRIEPGIKDSKLEEKDFLPDERLTATPNQDHEVGDSILKSPYLE